MTFEEFVSARLGTLVRYATVVTWDPHLAEDITQNVLVRAQARWARISRMDAPELYVKRMVVNEFLSWRRRRAAQSIPLATDTLAGHLPEAPDPSVQRDERDAMLRLIATLPPRQRAVIALRFYEDLAVDQIAEVLGCRTVTVRTHLMRALAALQNALPAPLVTTGEKP
ncbi:RNA polymerase sigma-70 factor (sigma-E family) [Actinoplanes campanulatus]|uniref:RNA polymerase sigma-70 factor (Sigma-E family) n=1 Tax=Actinoplanes campanulatus TaxID=113559 RepID=A0A7W5AGR6_9ACTN|nr:SigE family RNA polymerase sigma factor [Actinoplanes campanulatus]MBB3096031.1 RNA polymerase sigma-70 factor (sigma-E family) [Actinoplanes campanulatus]GGN13216.1 RNA polymerase sigma24 factor [Actinoplanes campanulatus]GID36875.1 RNA polymerase sigma24 factor [Actinoplanes campanulatus]